MNRTKIEWALNPDGTPGYTWNPITGCLNHVDGMCKGGNFPCYAYGLATTRLKGRYLANKNVADAHAHYGWLGSELVRVEDYHGHKNDPFHPRFWPEKLTIPFQRQEKGRGIFVCDMSDLFGIGVPEEWTWGVLAVIKCHPKDRFYLLTKQPQNLIKFSPFPDNCWVGVTATNDSDFRTAMGYMKRVEAKVKYISFEPLLDWSSYYEGVLTRNNSLGERWMKEFGIKWVIIGAQTKPTIYPKIEWVKEIVGACDKAGVKVFLKDNLNPLLNRKNYMTLELRQELPSA